MQAYKNGDALRDPRHNKALPCLIMKPVLFRSHGQRCARMDCSDFFPYILSYCHRGVSINLACLHALWQRFEGNDLI